MNLTLNLILTDLGQKKIKPFSPKKETEISSPCQWLATGFIYSYLQF